MRIIPCFIFTELILHYHDKFTDVSVNRFAEDTVLPFEVFANTDDGIIFLFDQGLPYDALVKEYLQERGINRIYVRVDDVPLLDEYIGRTRIREKRFDPEDSLSFKDYSFRKRQYCSIDKKAIVPRTHINFSLFFLDEYNFSSFMETTPELPISVDEHIANLPAEILIKKTDIPLYRAYLLSLSSPGHAMGEEGLDGLILKEEAKMIMHDVFRDSLTRERIQEVRGLVKRLTSFIEKGGNSFSALVSQNPGDLYPHVHAVNVAAISIGVALTLNLSVQAIEDLALGAILHDIGQSGINDEIINKQGKLVRAEYEVFKSHVMEGFGLLQHFEDVPKKALPAVAHHHEKITGDGYPYRLAGDEISLFGRIVAIVDTYDLLTTKRPYHVPQSSLKALTTLAKDAAKYDPAILKVFIKAISNQAK